MKGLSATSIVIFSVLVLVSASTSQFAFATGNDSPPECEGGTTDETGGPTTIDVGAGNIITGVCVKSGDEAVGDDQHSVLITWDATIADCYVVTGLWSSIVTITELPNCKAISHIDFFFEPGDMVGGHGGITDNTALLVSGSHLTASWMIPLLVSAVGIGVFIVTRK